MPFNGSGVFTSLYSWVQDAANGIDISSTRMDAQEADYTTNGFGNCITRDGQGSASQNQPMNTHRHTGAGNAVGVQDYATAHDIQYNALLFAVGSGSGDAITAAVSPALIALSDGMQFAIRSPGANTVTTPTFNPNGLGANTITKYGNQALAAGDIQSGQELILRYVASGTHWELLNPTPSTSGVSLSANNTWTGIQTFAPNSLPGGSNFSTIGLGIGRVASCALDVESDVSGAGSITLTNRSPSVAALADLVIYNGSTLLELIQFGVNFTTSGLSRQDGSCLVAGGTGGLTLETSVNQPIYFGINAAEVGRWTATGLGIAMTPARALDVTGTFGATGAATLGSTLGVTGATTLSSTLGVTGAATFSSTIAATGTMTQNAGLNVGYLEVLDSAGSGANSYTCVLADSGTMVRISGATKTVTIPANASVAYPVGTTLTFFCSNASGLSIAITSDTMTLANTTNTGTRTLARNGLATALKLTSTTWVISGVGIS